MDIPLIFKSAKEFLERNREKKIKEEVWSDSFFLNVDSESLKELLRNINNVTSIFGLVRVLEDIYVYPLPAIRRVIGFTLKRSLSFKIEGPVDRNDMISYVIYGGDVLYEVNFRVVKYGVNISLLFIIIIRYSSKSREIYPSPKELVSKVKNSLVTLIRYA